MKHLGDITKINGAKAPVVDCVIGGSPCQDLSVAGKRAGLAGERSGLYMDQLRIIKEMRNATNGTFPRFMVWENVPGAFSSNGGEDFRVVLEEAVRVCDKGVTIPRPKNGKWTSTGAIVGDGYSIAWRVMDAQYWGVPQRRKRIALVADFGGTSAPEILFECKGVSGNFGESSTQRKEIATTTERSTGAEDGSGMVGTITRTITGDNSVCCFEPGAASRLGGYVWEDVAPTLRAEIGDNRPSVAYAIQGDGNTSMSGNGCGYNENTSFTFTLNGTDKHSVCYSVNNQGGSVPQIIEDKAGCLTAGLNSGNNNVSVYVVNQESGTDGNNTPTVIKTPAIYDARVNGNGSVSCTITGAHQSSISDYTAIAIETPKNTNTTNVICYSKSRNAQDNQDYEKWEQTEVSRTLNTFDASETRSTNVVVGALCASDWKGASCNQYVDSNKLQYPNNIVRRLTPLECERLQGYPDNWTDIGEWTDTKGKKHQTTDTAQYKAMGNSIALPQWRFVLGRICEQIGRKATMASLFDGVGGFPLIWEEINGKGSAVWASEIEEFPIAVTKIRFPED